MKKILIVDDSETIVSLLHKSLLQTVKGAEVMVARNYKEGLKTILKHGKDIDVAILDLNLPDSKDGALIDIVEANGIKSIVLSGFLNDQFKKLIFEKDCIVDCVVKDGKKSIKSAVCAVNRIVKNAKRNILLVDDSKVQLSIASKILTKMNLNVVTAMNGKEALEILNKEDVKFSLVLTDYNMPQMDGMELTFRIREEYDKDELGIIVLSSSENTETAAQFLKIGANDFINKPYHETEVMTRVNSNLDLIDLFERTRDMANKDFMTGAYNRRYFFESGQNIFQKAKRAETNLALAMFDIDKFKSINDTYGHDVGDIAICEVCNILNAHMRGSDLMARFGGEEFCVLIDNISLEDTKNLFEKIRKAFEENVIKLETVDLKFTTSIGVCYGVGEDIEEMIKLADKGLYHCKENGRNQVHIEDIS